MLIILVLGRLEQGDFYILGYTGLSQASISYYMRSHPNVKKRRKKGGRGGSSSKTKTKTIRNERNPSLCMGDRELTVVHSLVI